MQNFTITTPEELEALMREVVQEELYKFLKKLQGTDHQLMTVVEVAELFGVSKVTIYKWKKEGILPFRYINSRVRFVRVEMMEILASKT